MQQIDAEPDKKAQLRFKKMLRDTMLASTDLFKVKPFFLSDEFSLVDATIAPVLWRLPFYEIDLPPQAQPIIKYAGLVFARPGFRDSLSEAERDMRTWADRALKPEGVRNPLARADAGPPGPLPRSHRTVPQGREITPLLQ